MRDHAKLGSQLGSSKLSNMYALSMEVIWKLTVVLLQSNGKENYHHKARGLIKNKGGITKGGANGKDSGWFGRYKQVQNQ